MNKDSHLIFEAYKSRPINENMPYPTFAKLSKHASPRSSREKSAGEFRQQMPDSKEEYSAHDYAKEMEARGENEENACIEDLATRHGVSLEDITNQLEMGLKVEMEHTEDMNVAKKIALDHLAEDPHYYTKLAKMEAENEEGDLMKHMKDKGMIDPKATDDTGKYGRTREEEESPEYVVGKTYTITMHNGEKFTGVFKYQRDMDRYDRSTGAYGSSWEQVLSNGTHEVVVGHGRPHHVPEEDEQRRLDPKCWKGYHKAGTKVKSGVRVNNCVKN